MAAKDEVKNLSNYTDQQGRTWYTWEDGNGTYQQSANPPNGTRVQNTETPTNSKSANVGGDNSKAFELVKDTNMGSWEYHGYGTLVGKNYESYRAALLDNLTTLIKSENGSASAESLLQQAERNPDPDNDGTNGAKNVRGNSFLYKSPSVSDASVGGNDAINPYSAFGLDDDIVHDLSINKGYTYGMGRCYGEMYESKQVILYLTMGIPKFRNLQTWLENATNKELSEMNDIGSHDNILSKIGKLLGSGLSLAIQLPWLPFKWGANIINSIKDTKVTEYFYFRDDMPLYYRYVNSILSEIAVGMGLYGNGNSGASSNNSNTKGNPSNGANIDNQMASKYEQNLPVIMREGPDIFKIMCRRASRIGGSPSFKSADEMLDNMSTVYTTANQLDKDAHIWDKLGTGLRNFWTGLETGALEGMNFLGFRVEKSDNANESFSNSTADSPLLATLNNEVAQKREKALGALTSGEGILSNAIRWAKNAQDFTARVNNVINGKGDIAGTAEATIAYMASGNGYFDLPKQWSGSAGMTRSLSFNMKLRARTGGDNVSIYQSIMIPLSCLIAAALPRGVGDSTYTSPFIIRAFCKGMFAVPAGIISTLSITRGSSEFGWSLSKLPTVVDVSFTIEDLSPILFLSIAGQGEVSAVLQAFTNNTKMHEYINTLVGIGAKERYYILGQFKRRLATAMLIGKNTIFSATYRGYSMGDSAIIRSLMAVFPWTRVPSN